MAFESDLSAFVREHFRSVWALELLLALKRDAQRCWAIEELVRDLRASTMLVTGNMASLEASGLVVRDDSGCFRYGPAAPVLDELCSALEAAYRQRPVAIVNLIARPDPLQSLADAFKFRGEPK